MYNKLFTKILDSSIWLESDGTRLVWLTMLACMDEDGYVGLPSIGNVAHRARVSLDAAMDAIEVLEGPDPGSSDPENDGRRIERVDGGWMVLNSEKYRSIVKREHAKTLNRERVRRHRARKAGVEEAPEEPLGPIVEKIRLAYPKQSHQRDAEQAILESINLGASTDEMHQKTLAIARKLKAWPCGGTGRYVPSPATFFQKERWREPVSEWEPKVDTSKSETPKTDARPARVDIPESLRKARELNEKREENE